MSRSSSRPLVLYLARISVPAGASSIQAKQPPLWRTLSMCIRASKSKHFASGPSGTMSTAV